MEPTRNLFDRHDLRCTEQRVAVYEALRGCTCHPTAEELYGMTRSRIARLSRATVYNTLEVLVDAGLARKLPVADGCCRYDADTSDHLHVRLPDRAEIRDVPADLGRRLVDSLPPDVLAEIEQAMGIRIDGLTIELEATVTDDAG